MGWIHLPHGVVCLKFLIVFYLHNYIHIIQLHYVGASLGNLYLDVCSVLNDLIVTNYSKCVPSAVVMPNMKIAHRRPLTLEMLNNSSLLTPLLVMNSMKSILLGMGVVLYFRCTANPEAWRFLQSILIQDSGERYVQVSHGMFGGQMLVPSFTWRYLR